MSNKIISNIKYQILKYWNFIFSAIFVFTFFIVFSSFAQAPPPPPPPPGGGNLPPTLIADIQPKLNSFKSYLQSLKQKFAALEQDAAAVLRPVYLVYGNDFVPNVVGKRIDIDINNFTKEKYKGYAQLYNKFIQVQEKQPDLKESFTGVLGEQVSVLYVVAVVGKIQNAIDYYIKAMNIDLNKASQDVQDNAKCFLEKINNIPSDAKKDKVKGLEYAIATFKCLVGTLKGLNDFTSFNAWMESIGTTFDRYFSSQALSQIDDNLSPGGTFDSPSNYPGELRDLIEPARHLLNITKQADALAKLKNFAGKAAYNFFANLIGAPGNDEAQYAIALFPVIMENIYNEYSQFVSKLKAATEIKSLKIGYKPVAQQGDFYDYEFYSGVDTACQWIIKNQGKTINSDECQFKTQVSKGEVNYEVKALGSPLVSVGKFMTGEEQKAQAPTGNSGGGGTPPGGTLPPVNQIEECTELERLSRCNSNQTCAKTWNQSQQAYEYKCHDKNPGSSGSCQSFYRSDQQCTPLLKACCAQNNQICWNGICVDDQGTLPPVLSNPCLRPENVSKCDPEKEKCVDDGKGNAVCVPKNFGDPGSPGSKKGEDFCPPNPQPKDGEISIPNPLCDPGLLELIGRIGRFLQRMAIILAPLIFIVAGIMYMTSGGNVEKTKKASLMMLWSAIGFMVVLLSFGLVSVLMDLLGYRQG